MLLRRQRFFRCICWQADDACQALGMPEHAGSWQAWARKLLNGATGSHLVGAFFADRLISYAQASCTSEEMEVEYIKVSHRKQGKGLGQALLRAALATFPDARLAKLKASQTNMAAKDLFRKLPLQCQIHHEPGRQGSWPLGGDAKASEAASSAASTP